MSKRLTHIQALRLLRQPDKWKRVYRVFGDELQTKDDAVRFYSDESITFRSPQTGKELLRVNLFAWPLFLFFGHRLNKRVPL
jgi:hypothetical protein